ncbi:adenylate/guanylate cyclase domain-containing protein [Rubrivirga marina]|uniref:Guanylate cyclase domain-containing protein n=1 Tax=Rubrivirga marina TaxID=1196024 RepID=A0A271IYL8_9BACT|nr:adenylate/guanylate cyclase domain-containing protein [Rubrivirga marina]PAP76356.1 hypothetical protein BSZ37_07815 [Rubrivirga marina]
MFLVGAWAAAAFVAARVVGLEPPPGGDDVPVWAFLRRSLLVGVLVGVPSAILELRALPRLARRLPFGATLAARTAVYAAVVTGALLLSAEWAAADEGGLAALYERGALGPFLRSSRFGALVAVLTVGSFLVGLAVQVRRVLGPGLVLDLALGRYLRPAWEDRLFLFLDLDGSTALARRLGPLAFTDLKNDVFFDLAEPVLATGGRVAEYVGDEVVVTWPWAPGIRTAAPLRCFFLVEDRLAARAGAYQARYGVAPTLKGACHGGRVVTAEVGDVKRELAHSGDVVNTAARIEGLCHALGARLLVSAEVVGAVDVPPGLWAVDRGTHAVRGRDEPVHVYAVERAPSPPTAGAGVSASALR